MIAEVTMYKVVCDWPECDASAHDGGEYVAFASPEGALEDFAYADNWRRGRDGKHFCDKHPTTWASDHENGEPFPEPPYLLIHDGDTDDPGDDGYVTCVWRRAASGRLIGLPT
jgi:hypothetical protein